MDASVAEHKELQLKEEENTVGDKILMYLLFQDCSCAYTHLGMCLFWSLDISTETSQATILYRE